jgi:hypothetical protein
LLLLFLARKQEINAINRRIKPTTIIIQPARKRDLNKRIASKEIHIIHFASFLQFNHLTILFFYYIIIIRFTVFTKITIVTTNQKMENPLIFNQSKKAYGTEIRFSFER